MDISVLFLEWIKLYSRYLSADDRGFWCERSHYSPVRYLSCTTLTALLGLSQPSAGGFIHCIKYRYLASTKNSKVTTNTWIKPVDDNNAG